MIKPECISCMLFSAKMEDNESLIITGNLSYLFLSLKLIILIIFIKI